MLAERAFRKLYAGTRGTEKVATKGRRVEALLALSRVYKARGCVQTRQPTRKRIDPGWTRQR
jgi:hypothetical protein